MSQEPDATEHPILAIVLGGTTGFVFVFILLSCICRLRKSAPIFTNESSDGYQDIRETNGPRRFQHPFSRKPRTVVNGNVTRTRSNSSNNCARPHNFPTGPLPILPTSSSIASSATGPGRGAITRESSTSELYASVDRNPANLADREFRRESADSTEENGKTDCNYEHTYSKIRPPVGTYDEIDDIPSASSKRSSAPIISFPINRGDSVIDPVYSRVNDTTVDTDGPAPPPVPRLPRTRTAHPYDYPKFFNNTGQDRWPAANAVQRMPIDRALTGANVDSTFFNGADALYSKIESQYGGSEDPYSSIKSSEEHYSSVVPNHVSNGSSGDENHANTDGPAAVLHGRTETAPTYGSIRPRSLRYIRPRRSRSYGEYSVIQKPSVKGFPPNDDPRAPPVPEKRYFAATHPSTSRVPMELSNSTVRSNHGHEASTSQSSGTNFDASQSAPNQHGSTGQSETTGAKREPNYRFITVRESLDALRARMEAAAAANIPTTAASVGMAQSDPSLHYYATISENSYEVVPSRRGSESVQPEELDCACRAVSYIDEDEYEVCPNGQFLSVSDRSPNSTKLESDTSSATLMNVSVHSHTGSHATSSGSHVTLVHVGGLHATSTVPEDASHNNKGNGKSGLDGRCALGEGTSKAPMCRIASSDDSTSTGAALSIDIESNFGIDENLSTVDHRDFNPSTTDCIDACSRVNSGMEDDGESGSVQLPNDSPLLKYKRDVRSSSAHSPNARTPEIVELETLENFNVSSNSLNDEASNNM